MTFPRAWHIGGLCLLLIGCSVQEESSEPSSNSEIKVQKLFHHEGCTVYRFYDARTVYYVTCGNGIARTSWTRNTGGKANLVINEAVNTAGVNP